MNNLYVISFAMHLYTHLNFVFFYARFIVGEGAFKYALKFGIATSDASNVS